MAAHGESVPCAGQGADCTFIPCTNLWSEMQRAPSRRQSSAELGRHLIIAAVGPGSGRSVFDPARFDGKLAESPFITSSIYIGIDDIEYWDCMSCAADEEYQTTRRTSVAFGSGCLVPDAELRQNLESLGLHDRATVVLYRIGHKTPNADALCAARIAWALLYAGIEDVKLLDGGYDAWVAQGLPVSCSPIQLEPSQSFLSSDIIHVNPLSFFRHSICNYTVPHFQAKFHSVFPKHPEYKATTNLVEDYLTCLGDGSCPDVTFADVRSWSEYVGESHDYSYMGRLGHLPGARWAHWGPTTYSGDDFWQFCAKNKTAHRLARKVIAEIWQANGITAHGQNVFYCGTGWRSALAFMIARSLGWQNISNYDGGWLEWAHTHPNALHHEVRTGAMPKREPRPRQRRRSMNKTKAKAPEDEKPAEHVDANLQNHYYSLGERLAIAKQEVLATLHRDHRHDGGITMEGLNDATSALTSLAQTSEEADLSWQQFYPPVVPQSVPQSSPGLRVSPHDADLQLRAVIKSALRSSATNTNGSHESSRSQSHGSSRSQSNASSRSQSCSRSPSTMTQPDELVSSGCMSCTDALSISSQAASFYGLEQQDVQSVQSHDAVGSDEPAGSQSAECSIHQADLKLRQAVREILSAGVNRSPEFRKKVSAAKQRALADLRRMQGGRGACVDSTALETAVSALRDSFA